MASKFKQDGTLCQLAGSSGLVPQACQVGGAWAIWQTPCHLCFCAVDHFRKLPVILCLVSAVLLTGFFLRQLPAFAYGQSGKELSNYTRAQKHTLV